MQLPPDVWRTGQPMQCFMEFNEAKSYQEVTGPLPWKQNQSLFL